MISWELHYLAAAVTLGAVLALVYDLLRVLRRIIPHSTFWIAVQDIVFWMMASIVFFALCFLEDAGKVRFFSILGVIGGTLIYHATVGRFLVKYTYLVLVFPFKVLKKLAKSFKIKVLKDL